MQAPFDPLQLLKALSSLLSTQGGIKSDNEVPRLSSLMKKFSKKLVSRCIYVHVLISTTPEVLNKFLDQDGWNTIKSWMQEAKDGENWPFMVELLRLCEVLPMTVERLKENNTAKLVKSLTKTEHDEVKRLSSKVVGTWMKLITGAKDVAVAAEKNEKVKKRKKKDKGDGKDKTKEFKEVKEEQPEEEDWLKKGRKNRSSGHSSTSERKRSNEDINLEDVEIKVPKTDTEKEIDKLRESRPKTVKTFHAKFRSTGLIEENPPPKPLTKKSPTIDPTVALVAAKAAKKRSLTPLGYSEKKLKPSSLITPASECTTVVTQGGIKLIPAKPRPLHVLHESAGFMDALVSVPSQPVRKKKRGGAAGATTGNKTPPSPTSPTIGPPKLEFYKDTLELGEKDSESKSKDNSSEETSNNDEENKTSKDSEDDDSKDKSGESTDCESEKVETNTESQEDDDGAEKDSQASASSGEVKSILSIVKKKGKKKSVKWRQDKDLKEFFYFEMDETERVNVNNVKDFGEMKSFEMKRERAAFESAKRQHGDKMTEGTVWKGMKTIDLIPALVEPGWNSKEKEIQKQRQQSTLQEIYFTKDMIPDSPGEPEPENHAANEPIQIPLDDMNNPSALMDYSSLDLPPPKPALPPVLTSLMMSITGQQFPAGQEMMAGQMGMPGEMPPPNIGGPMGGSNFVPMNPVTQEIWTGAAPEWPSSSDNGPPEGYFPNPALMNAGPPMGPGHPNFPQNMPFNRPPPNIRPPFMGPPGPNNAGNRPMQPQPGGNRRFPPTTPCKHFMNGTCRFGPGCKFLHPGINGPVL